MLVTEYNTEGTDPRFLIRPNCSMSPQTGMLVFAAVAGFFLLVATLMAMLGAWLVLPFSGAELAALGVALYVVNRRCHQVWETISLQPDQVSISKGHHRGEEGPYSFQRSWAHVVLQPRSVGGSSNRLLIRSHGQQVEVGACLGEEERQGLAQELGRVLGGGYRRSIGTA